MDYDYRFPYTFVPDHPFQNTSQLMFLFLFIPFPLKAFKINFLICICFCLFKEDYSLRRASLAQTIHYKQKNVDGKPLIHPF